MKRTGRATGLYTESMSDWDAARYHRISDPQLAWGRAVLSRLSLSAGEWILDLGCGTGRLTEEIAASPGLFVVGLDRSAAMLQQATASHRQASHPPPPRGQTPSGAPGGGQTPNAGFSNDCGENDGAHAAVTPETTHMWGQTLALNSYTRAVYVRGDGAALPFAGAFDAVFSAATFHWIPDHERLFQSIHTALKAGGRLVAQAGGGRNLDRLYGRARELRESPAYARFFTSWSSPSHFENVPDTEDRLRRAGFEDIEVSLVPSPVPFATREAYAEFVAPICLRHQLDRLPAGMRDAFVQHLTDQAAQDDPPFTLDYWRLNISARKAVA